MNGVSPFVHALGGDLDRLAPAVRRHLAQISGASLLVGHLSEGWRRGGPLGWLLTRVLRLDFGAVPAGARFELRNGLLPGDTMLWRRTLIGGRGTIDNFGVVRWDPRRRSLVDTIGRRRAIEVELVPSVEGTELVLTSRRQWLCVAGVRMPLPRVLAGSARVREWEGVRGTVVLRLELRHPWLGGYAGYEAEFGEGR